MKTISKPKQLKATPYCKASGQAMIEYVAVISALFVLLIGSHNAWEAMNGNRSAMMDNSTRNIDGRDYGDATTPVIDGQGNENRDAVSFKDALHIKRDKMRDTLSELTF